MNSCEAGSGKREAGRSLLAQVAKEANTRGFILLARKAEARLKAPPP